jgi:hypothetical protein
VIHEISGLKGNDLRLEDFGWAGGNMPP